MSSIPISVGPLPTNDAEFILAASAAVIVVFLLLTRYVRVSEIMTENKQAPEIKVTGQAIRQHDSSFDEKDFLKFAHETFFAVQDARRKSEPQLVQLRLSEDLWWAFAHVQQQMNGHQRHVVIEHLKLHRSSILSAVNIGDWDCVTVRMVASCAEFEQDSKRHTYGDRRIKSWREDWTFERSSDPATRLRPTWSLTQVHPVSPDRFGAPTRRSMTEWTPIPAKH